LVAKPIVKNIKREKAICIFFFQDYTEFNVEKLEETGKFEDVDICYDEDPLIPILLCNKRIDSNPQKYKKYNSSSLSAKTI
jgi:hypothetical protein